MNKILERKTNKLHPRNKHNGRYDFEQLIATNQTLANYARPNEFNDISIDFTNPEAVKALNQALLAYFYNISNWDIPTGYLCPPIPGRADYIHHVADLLAIRQTDPNDLEKKVCVLDIGLGANAIYPLIGFREYGWHFIGADIDKTAIKSAQNIIDSNDGLADAIRLRHQTAKDNIFKNIISANDKFDVTMCNPPFHASLKDALAGTQRKWQNLAVNQTKNSAKKIITNKISSSAATLNFGGQANELYCIGGEEAFIKRMINESVFFKNQCYWFTTLVSKATTLPMIYLTLKEVKAIEVKTIEMAQGQKRSRIVAWSFLNKQQQLMWKK